MTGWEGGEGERHAGHAPAFVAVRSVVGGPALEGFLANPQGEIPVGVLDEETRDWLGAKVRLVWLPAWVVRKQQKRHPDLEVADYRRLPDVLGKPDFVLRRMPARRLSDEVLGRRLNLVREVGRKTCQAVLERNRNGSKVKLVTFFEVGKNYLRILNEEARTVLRKPS